TSGTIIIDGKRISDAGTAELFRFRRETVSFIFQTFNLFPGLTALENVQFGVDVSGRRAEHDRARATLAEVGLGERLDHFPQQLSGGEQQRVAIARALATGNPLMLADEPTGELDFQTGIQILELLHAQSHRGTTVLIVTHNREIARVADRVIELSSGHVIADGPPVGGHVDVDQLRW
ncbi:MAG: ABC transporter ATP-binding protein, partial [Acidimicrobiia bacterium]